MRRFFAALFVIVALLVVFALVGTSLPEGNPLRDAAEGLRAVGRGLGRGFGGGYGELPAAP